MYAIKELKLQSFKDAFLPKPRVLFARYGYCSNPNKSMSGDKVLPVRQSKAEVLTEMNKELFEES